MILVIFSDIHGNGYAFNRFLEDIAKVKYDYLVFCGDIFGYYYNQQNIFEHLQGMKNMIWLKGNHDSYAVLAYYQQERIYNLVDRFGHSYEQMFTYLSHSYIQKLEELPIIYELKSGNEKIVISHGTLDNSLEGRLYPNDLIKNAFLYQKYDYVILGHTHYKMKRMCGKTMIINPGSLGQPRDGNGFGYAILDTESKKVEFKNIDYPKEQLYKEIEMYDPELKKLKEVLERGHTCEKNLGNSN